MTTITVWVDGSHHRGVGAWGALVQQGERQRLFGRAFPCSHSGINYVELRGVVEGIKRARRFGRGQIVVYTDSQYVVHSLQHLERWHMLDWRKTNGWQQVRFAPDWSELRRLLLVTGAEVQWRGRCSTAELIRVDTYARYKRTLLGKQHG